jgi:hypothetical protein
MTIVPIPEDIEQKVDEIVRAFLAPCDEPAKRAVAVVVGRRGSGKSAAVTAAAARVQARTGCRVIRWDVADTLMQLPRIDLDWYPRHEDGTRVWSLLIADNVDEAIMRCKGVGCVGLRRTLAGITPRDRVWVLMTATSPGGELSSRMLRSLKDEVDHVVCMQVDRAAGRTGSPPVDGSKASQEPGGFRKREPTPVDDAQLGRWERAVDRFEAEASHGAASDDLLGKIAESMRAVIARWSVHNFSAGGVNIRR